MRFRWIFYKDEHAALLESWLDDEARRFTGCSDGWLDYYAYWLNESTTEPGRNFWVLRAGEDSPQMAFVIGKAPNGLFTVSECFVKPACRGQGIGTAALKELLTDARTIIGEPITDMQAVVFPHNTASRRMFEHAGFRLAAMHPDGDALYYHYAPTMPCYCGHDCARCITRLAAVTENEALRQQTVEFYRTALHRDIPFETVRCCGGRSDDVFTLCRECPFVQCCREKGIDSCDECPDSPCAMLADYREKFVNRCHQI